MFAKQVQVDLLALSDVDLFQTVQQWVNGEPSGLSHPTSKETRSALGYVPRVDEPHTLSPNIPLESALETEIPWLAPAPHQLRALLANMDVQLFTQYVLPVAFQALHAAYPEWDEGETFNAHLAHYLRQVAMKRRAMTRE